MSTVEDIVEFLDEEYRVLSEGRLSELPGIIERKEALHTALSSSKAIEKDDLERIARMAERNAGHIEAAKRGVAAAFSELADIRKGLEQAIYGQNGERQALSSVPPRMERKV